MPSWSRDRRYILMLAGASAVILLLGALLRPQQNESERIAPVAQADMARLQRLSVRNYVNDLARYFADLADLLESQVVRLPGAGRSGVVWESDRVASSGGPVRPPSNDQGVGRTAGDLALDLIRFVPSRPVALYEVTGAAPISVNVRAPSGLNGDGSWTMAAWREQDGQLAYQLGQFLGEAEADCDGFTGTQLRLNIDLSSAMLGGGVFDYDGALMGLIVACSGEVLALNTATVAASLAAPEQIEDRLAGNFGIVVGALSEMERKALEADSGVLIRQVWRGYQGSAAGLLPGDVIVGLDSKPVNGSADLERMTLPIAREVFDLKIVRAGRSREIQVKARPEAKAAYGPGGVAWAESPAGLPIGGVDPAGRLAKAGVRPGDRLIQIDGERADSETSVEKALAEKSKPLFAVFEREGRLWGAVICVGRRSRLAAIPECRLCRRLRRL